MRKINWKSRRPTSLSEAFDLDEAHGLHEKRLSRKAMEELMDASRSKYGRWITDLEMPVGRLRQFSMLCGSTFVIEYLATASGKLVIDIPTGRKISAEDLHTLQEVLNEVVGRLIKFYANKADSSETLGAIQTAMESLAFHRGNVEKHMTPELEFGHE